MVKWRSRSGSPREHLLKLQVSQGVTAAPPVRTRATTSVENRKYLARAAAWTYLVASCTDKAYALIERADGDPFKAWTILQEKYCATDAEENYPELSEAFGKCKLSETKEDPELWFNDLDHLNMRIARINTKYELDDLQMKSHIMTSMSSGYDSVVVKYRGELAETPLVKLRKEIGLQYKTLLKATKNKSESALVANVNKHPYKKFKGTCRNCGKIGHKANECRSAKSTAESADSTKTPVDKSNVTCFNCQEKGHYANKCPKPKKDKADNDMAMFVGLSRIEVDVEAEETPKVVVNDCINFTPDDFSMTGVGAMTLQAMTSIPMTISEPSPNSLNTTLGDDDATMVDVSRPRKLWSLLMSV
ncbi:hypothetical protein MHU86_12197 [Fragilaria crotonensis]|nr:hypothetical protein MHU86_12197 [Fragilaria crotonensis]